MRERWVSECEIIEDYTPRHGSDRKRVVVRHIPSGMFLRYSRGPSQGHFWDGHGENYITKELATAALYTAPPPPLHEAVDCPLEADKRDMVIGKIRSIIGRLKESHQPWEHDIERRCYDAIMEIDGAIEEAGITSKEEA